MNQGSLLEQQVLLSTEPSLVSKKDLNQTGIFRIENALGGGVLTMGVNRRGLPTVHSPEGQKDKKQWAGVTHCCEGRT